LVYFSVKLIINLNYAIPTTPNKDSTIGVEMMKAKLMRGLLSIYIMISLVGIGFIGLLIFSGMVNTPGAEAATLIVDANGNGDYLTIHEAVENASIGDTVRVWAGYYNENIGIYSSVNLIGNGSANTTIDGFNIWWLSTITIGTSDVNISGFNIINSKNIGVEVYSSSNVNIHNNTIKQNGYGIYIWDSNNITVANNHIKNNSYGGILIESSYWNRIINNNITKNKIGVYLGWSLNQIISNNTMFKNGFFISGWDPNYWSSHIIDTKNSANGKPIYYWKNRNSGTVPSGAGQVILAKCTNIVVQNQNCSNCTNGILIGHCSDLLIDKNIFMINDYYGITVEGSNNLTISNNKCEGNHESGIRIQESVYINIHNNTFNYNDFQGIWFSWDCSKNIIKNNTCNYNGGTGIFLSDYDLFNNIEGNNVSYNYNGIYLSWDASSNEIFENLVSFNTNDGIYIESWSFNNEIYHNNIISNARQANDQSGSTDWSKGGEGNYWSDYSGVDNGAGGRNKGDGIGDTNIPHPSSGYDNYPFTQLNGWRYPGTPVLRNPGELDSDGNYTVSWENNPRATGFILQEDESPGFESPNELLNGSSDNSYFNLTNKPEGTYYYRLKVFNEYYYSDWSAVENITVNYLPGVPRGFRVTVFSYGNTLYLTWELNTVDTSNYELFYRTQGMFDWEMLANITHPNDTYLHSGLLNGQEYKYRIRSRDSFLQESPYSEIITGIPMDSLAPTAPTGLIAEAKSDSKIELTWNANTDDDLEGYLIFMHDPTEDEEDEFNLIHTIKGTLTKHNVAQLQEQVNYSFKIKAYDEVPNNSTFSDEAWAFTPDETHPPAPEGLVVFNATYDSLSLSWEPSPEVDIIGYEVYRSTSLSGDYEKVSELINSTQFIDSGLEEDTIYYYKLKAVDDALLYSLFSDHAFGMTRIGPKPPEINHSIDDFDLPEDTWDDVTINLYYLFKDINNDELTFRVEGQEHINVTIDQIFGEVMLIPEENWNGEETLTFYANDGMHDDISFEITITVTGENDPPGPAKILKPENNLKLREDEKLHFEGSCWDPDLEYGDTLTFRWQSSISGEIGVGSNLSDVLLTTGEHVITLEVWDSTGKKATDSINLDVLEKSSKPDGGFGSDLLIYIVVLIIVIVILLAIAALYLKKRKKKGLEAEKTKLGAEAELVKSEQQEPGQTTAQIQIPDQIQMQLFMQQQPQMVQNYLQPPQGQQGNADAQYGQYPQQPAQGQLKDTVIASASEPAPQLTPQTQTQTQSQTPVQVQLLPAAKQKETEQQEHEEKPEQSVIPEADPAQLGSQQDNQDQQDIQNNTVIQDSEDPSGSLEDQRSQTENPADDWEPDSTEQQSGDSENKEQDES
jgi:parallel beta-helix repeat protein